MTSCIQPIELASLSDRAADRLRDAMLKGLLKSGERLVERDLAERLGISKTALREALIRLEHEGLIQRTRNKETRVALVPARQIEETNQIRIPLEAVAFMEAHSRLTPEAEKHCRDLILRMDRASRKRDCHAYSTLDFEFHQYIWRLCGNETLYRLLVHLCRPLFAYCMIELRKIPSDTLENPGNHTALLEAIRKGDASRIETSLRNHIQNSWYPVQEENA